MRVFRTPTGYLAWADGLGTVEGRTLAETRRAARRLVEAVVAGAFPDRPSVDATGTWEILEFRLDVRRRLPPPSGPKSREARGPNPPDRPAGRRKDGTQRSRPRLRAASEASAP